MSVSAKDQILGGIRRSLGRTGPLDAKAKAVLTKRLKGHARHLQLSRIDKPHAELVELFVEMAKAVSATVARIDSLDDVPGAVADYLASENLPARLAASPELEGIPWSNRPTLDVRHGPAQDSDVASVTPSHAGIAETGTLMLASGPTRPSTLNFLPDNHIVVLKASDIVGAYEDGWDRLRALNPDGLPRTVNFITGPSRTGDIEQRILLGAHGPRRLHIVLVDEK